MLPFIFWENGPMLKSWGELKEMAKTRFMESRANEYHKTIKKKELKEV